MKQNHAARSQLLAITTAAALLGLAAGSATASEAIKASKAATVSADAGASSMRVYIDPATGNFRQPTPEELSAESQQTISSASDTSKGGGVVITLRADGTMRGLDTAGHLMESAVATRSPDGKISIQYGNGDAPANVAEEK